MFQLDTKIEEREYCPMSIKQIFLVLSSSIIFCTPLGLSANTYGSLLDELRETPVSRKRVKKHIYNGMFKDIPRDSMYQPPLAVLARNSMAGEHWVDVANMLIRVGADPNLVPLAEDTAPALHAAAANCAGDIKHNNVKKHIPKFISSMVHGGAVIDMLWRGSTALHLSAANGCVDGVRALLRHGANRSLTNQNGETAADLAKRIYSSDPSAAASILQLLGSTPISKAEARELSGNRIACRAARDGDVNMMSYALTEGANPNTKCDGELVLLKSVRYQNVGPDGLRRRLTMATALIDAGASVTAAHPRTGRTVLHFAAQNCDFPLFEYLLKKGADPSVRDHSGNTFYDLSASCIETFRRRLLAATNDISDAEVAVGDLWSQLDNQNTTLENTWLSRADATSWTSDDLAQVATAAIELLHATDALEVVEPTREQKYRLEQSRCLANIAITLVHWERSRRGRATEINRNSGISSGKKVLESAHCSSSQREVILQLADAYGYLQGTRSGERPGANTRTVTQVAVGLVALLLLDYALSDKKRNNRHAREVSKKHSEQTKALQRGPEIGACVILPNFGQGIVVEIHASVVSIQYTLLQGGENNDPWSHRARVTVGKFPKSDLRACW